jgi:PST family polysaccharide transporter
MPREIDARYGGTEDFRSIAARIYRGAAILAVAQIVSRAIGLIYTFLLARVLTIADFGTYNLVLTVIVIAGLLQDVGLSKSVVKEVARAPESGREWIEKLLPLKFGLGLIAMVIVPVVASSAGYSKTTIDVLVLAAFILPSSNVWLLFENVAQGRNAILVLSFAYIVNTALQSGLGLCAAAFTAGNLAAVAIAMVVGNFASAILLGIYLRRNIGGFIPRIDVSFWKASLRDSLPYLGIGVIAVSLGRIEALLLGRLANDVEVALFVVGFKFFETLLFIVHTFQIAINPSLAQALAVDREFLSTLFAWQLTGSLAVAIPVALCLVLGSGMLIAALFPPDFANAKAPTIVFFSALPFAVVQIFASGLLTLTNRQHATMTTLAAVLGCEIVLNLVLIPAYGALGAAISVATCQILGAAVTVFLVRRWLLPNDQVYKAIGRIGLAVLVALPAGIGCLLFTSPIFAAVTAIIAYSFVLASLRIGILPPKAA